MPQYSVLEYKLRRYIYLGHKLNIYVPRAFRKTFWKNRLYHDDIVGIKLIGNVAKKGDINEINSIVPILSKIKKENTFLEDHQLIFLLAACTRFRVDRFKNMVNDAYKAVLLICTDGSQILKFAYMVKLSAYLLFKLGYIKSNSIGYGSGFRRVVRKWYLDNDPYEITRQIIMHRHYNGISHRDLMEICHLDSPDPCHKIFILNTFSGFEMVKSKFSPELIEDDNESIVQHNSRLQLLLIYFYLEKMNWVFKTEPSQSLFSMTWEKDFLSIPQKCLNSYIGLNFFVTHCPLKILLNNTFSLAKKRYFHNLLNHQGCWTFIARFNETEALKQSNIHPIEPYLEYIRYQYSGNYVFEIYQKKLKIAEEKNWINKWTTNGLDSTKVPAITNKSIKSQTKNPTQQLNILSNGSTLLKVPKFSKKVILDPPKLPEITKNFIATVNHTQKINIWFNNSTCFVLEHSSRKATLDSIEVVMPVVVQPVLKIQKKPETETKPIEKKIKKPTKKPIPKRAAPLLKFLSEDLLEKSLKNLKPLKFNILIAYDGRHYTTRKFCKYMSVDFLHVSDAIVLTILSIIYPISSNYNKPIICSLNDSVKKLSIIKLDDTPTLTFKTLKQKLYQDMEDYNIQDLIVKPKKIYPLNTVQFVTRSGQNVDVFIYLGTKYMCLKKIISSKIFYENFLGKKVKIIVCSLTGGHTQQMKAYYPGVLFIIGYDKNVGKIIHSFLNEEF